MIDNVTIRTRYSNQEFEGLVERLALPITINSDKIKFDWSNLRFAYYPNTNHLSVSNSLHKFYNLEFNELVRAPVNYNAFTFCNFYTVVGYLSEVVFEKAASDLSVSTRFEFGLNIDVDHYKPFDIISKYQSCVSTHPNEFFTNVPYKGKPLQRSCHFSDWFIKGYDKSKQTNIQNVNLLRFEVVVAELRKLRQILGIESISLADLCTNDAWEKMSQFLFDTYDKIRKVPEIKDFQLTRAEIDSIYEYCNKMERGDLKRHLSRYFFEIVNKENKAVYDKYNSSDLNYHNDVKNKMKQLYLELMPASVEFQHV